MSGENDRQYAPQHEGNAFVLLLRDRRVFTDFVAAFVDIGAFAQQLRFEAATLLERKYITETLREGERDVLWKVPAAAGELFVILLVEHQSTIDHGMPMRLLLYMNALWQDHYYATDVDIRRSRRFRAPPILPIVLYTGEQRWSGATRLIDVIAGGEELKELLPDFRFQVIDFFNCSDADFAVPGNFACSLLHVVWALMKGLPGADFAGIFDRLRPLWGPREVELLGAVLYHHACAEGRSDMAQRLYDTLRPQEVVMIEPEVMRKRFWEVWAEEGRAEGEARKEMQNLREQLDAIKAFFTRKGLPWEAYAAEIEGLSSHREAADFLVDLATSPDMAGFLRQRFGH